MHGTENLPNMEDTSVFALSGYQYIIMAVVLTKGYPYKKPLYYNGESSEMSKDDDLGSKGDAHGPTLTNWLAIHPCQLHLSLTPTILT